MLSFLAAMVFVFFDKTNMVTKITLGALLGVLVFLIVVLLYMEWDGGSPRSGLFIFRKDLHTYIYTKYFQRSVKKSPGADGPKAGAAGKDGDSDVGTSTSAHVSIDFESASSTDVSSPPSVHSTNEKDNDATSNKALSMSSTSDSESSLKKRRWLPQWTLTRRGTMDSDTTLHQP